MRKNEIHMRKEIHGQRPNSIEEELLNMTQQEDRELYIFMRGGFAAK